MSPEPSRELYSPRQRRQLARGIQGISKDQEAGRAVCPFCKHMEARWRATPLEDQEDRYRVRVRCSQCQLSGVVEIPPPPRWSWLRKVLGGS